MGLFVKVPSSMGDGRGIYGGGIEPEMPASIYGCDGPGSIKGGGGGKVWGFLCH
jgi:hypothetical protein